MTQVWWGHMADLIAARLPDRVDVHVGTRIRLSRRMQGVSQEALADTLGLSSQQVQKYEIGDNRVSASKLYEIASALHCPISYFFDGLADPSAGDSSAISPSSEHIVHAFLMTGEGLDLAKFFSALRQGRVRRRILALMHALTAAGEDQDREG